MLLWTWHNQETRWHAQHLERGEEVSLSEDARLWVVQDDLAILFARPSVGLNGCAALPLQPLADRDEIVIGTAHWCVSFATPPERNIFRAAGQLLQCARCCGPFTDGEHTITCPRCRARYHDSDSLRCWTYGPVCARCHRSTSETLWEPAPLRRSPRRSRHGEASTSR